MTSGDVATYVIAAVILVVFGIGARKIYRNFFRGESECCGSDNCSSCSSCSSGHTKKS